ncbi:hypothetical protein ZWY2020_031876 [Hordeum vulgare]|nr:hypothetical protein ZWY2020_031876 [Hordeum vulgare]
MSFTTACSAVGDASHVRLPVATSSLLHWLSELLRPSPRHTISAARPEQQGPSPLTVARPVAGEGSDRLAATSSLHPDKPGGGKKCAITVEALNLSRVQHLFYVLNELAPISGDANHMLATYGEAGAVMTVLGGHTRDIQGRDGEDKRLLEAEARTAVAVA